MSCLDRASTVGGEHSRKKPFEQLVAIRNIYIWDRDSFFPKIAYLVCEFKVFSSTFFVSAPAVFYKVKQ